MDRSVDFLQRSSLTFGSHYRSFCLRLRSNNLRFGKALSHENRTLLLTLRRKNRALLFSFCNQNGGAALSLSFELLLHGFLYRPRWVDCLELNSVDPNTPLTSCFVKDPA